MLKKKKKGQAIGTLPRRSLFKSFLFVGLMAQLLPKSTTGIPFLPSSLSPLFSVFWFKTPPLSCTHTLCLFVFSLSIFFITKFLEENNKSVVRGSQLSVSLSYKILQSFPFSPKHWYFMASLGILIL